MDILLSILPLIVVGVLIIVLILDRNEHPNKDNSEDFPWKD